MGVPEPLVESPGVSVVRPAVGSAAFAEFGVGATVDGLAVRRYA